MTKQESHWLGMRGRSSQLLDSFLGDPKHWLTECKESFSTKSNISSVKRILNLEDLIKKRTTQSIYISWDMHKWILSDQLSQDMYNVHLKQTNKQPYYNHIHLTGINWTPSWPASNKCFMAQLVEHGTNIVEVIGSNLVEASDCFFSGLSL